MGDRMSVMRNGLVDYARLLAAVGIIWFHAQAPGSVFAYVALPFFLVLLALPSKASVSVKAQRLLVPFVSWSLIYALINIALAVKNNRPPLGWWSPDSRTPVRCPSGNSLCPLRYCPGCTIRPMVLRGHSCADRHRVLLGWLIPPCSVSGMEPEVH
jgi:hypothetical protein